jgi:hypothetical protein
LSTSCAYLFLATFILEAVAQLEFAVANLPQFKSADKMRAKWRKKRVRRLKRKRRKTRARS